jgi:hypothetical protein
MLGDGAEGGPGFNGKETEDVLQLVAHHVLGTALDAHNRHLGRKKRGTVANVDGRFQLVPSAFKEMNRVSYLGGVRKLLRLRGYSYVASSVNSYFGAGQEKVLFDCEGFKDLSYLRLRKSEHALPVLVTYVLNRTGLFQNYVLL